MRFIYFLYFLLIGNVQFSFCDAAAVAEEAPSTKELKAYERFDFSFNGRPVSNLITEGGNEIENWHQRESEAVRIINEALKLADEEKHHEAYAAYKNVIKSFDEGDSVPRVRIAEYLIHGIRGYIEASESTKTQAVQYLIEAAQIEFSRPDEPDEAGRMIRSYSEESYQALRRLDTDTAKSLLIERLVSVESEPF